MGHGRYAPDRKRFPGAQIVYILDYDTDGTLEGGGGSGGGGIASVAFVPTTQVVLLAIANQEYPIDITGASRVEFSARTSQEVRYGYSQGITQGDDYRTLGANDEKSLDFGFGLYSGNLYFSSSIDGVIVELEVWKRAD